MTPDKVEEWVEYCAEVCDSVEFLRGVPVQLPNQTKALLRGRVREALIQRDQDMMSEVVERIKVLRKELWLDYHNAEKWSEQKAVAEAVDDIIKSLSK